MIDVDCLHFSHSVSFTAGSKGASNRKRQGKHWKPNKNDHHLERTPLQLNRCRISLLIRPMPVCICLFWWPRARSHTRKLHVPSLPSQTVPSPASAPRPQVLTLSLKEPQACANSAISENIRILFFHHSGAAILWYTYTYYNINVI